MYIFSTFLKSGTAPACLNGDLRLLMSSPEPFLMKRRCKYSDYWWISTQMFCIIIDFVEFEAFSLHTSKFCPKKVFVDYV